MSAIVMDARRAIFMSTRAECDPRSHNGQQGINIAQMCLAEINDRHTLRCATVGDCDEGLQQCPARDQ